MEAEDVAKVVAPYFQQLRGEIEGFYNLRQYLAMSECMYLGVTPGQLARFIRSMTDNSDADSADGTEDDS